MSVDVVNDLEENKQELSIIEAQLLEKQTDAEQLTERLRVSREDCERAKLALDEAKKFYERKMSENASIQVAIGLAKDSLKELTSSVEKLRKEVKRRVGT